MPLKAHENLHWEDSSAQEYLERDGSKAGALQFLLDTQPALHGNIPSGQSYIMAPGNDPDEFVKMIKATGDHPMIVRGCHPLDFTGMVDVVESIKGLRTIDEIRCAIHEILEQAKTSEVQAYMNYEAPGEYDGNLGILVQRDYGKSSKSIIEHPNQPGIYRIEKNNNNFAGGVDVAVCDEKGENLSNSMDANTGTEVLDLYRAVAESGLIPRDHTFQMEYGWSNEICGPIFYQARLFKKKEIAAPDFKPMKDETPGYTEPYSVFGITSEGGILVSSLAPLYQEVVEAKESEKNVAYFRSNYQHTLRLKDGDVDRELEIMPKNMAAYIPEDHALLEHGHFRWMQKATLTLGFAGPSVGRILRAIKERSIRFYSNGIEGFVSFED